MAIVKKLKFNYGFTLIELLIVLVVLSILGLVAAQLFSSVLKGTNKASVISEVKQNGQFILDTLERHIRTASNITIAGNILTLTTDSGLETITFVVGCRPNSGCGLPANGQIQLNGAPINNTDIVSGVDVTSVNFSQIPVVEGLPKVVQLDITLNQGVAAASRKDFQANVRLVNTYSLRTY